MVSDMSKAEKLLNEITKNQQLLYKLQDKCKHPDKHRTETHGASTGNYDPFADRYWIEYTCNLCKKRWRIYFDIHGKKIESV